MAKAAQLCRPTGRCERCRRRSGRVREAAAAAWRLAGSASRRRTPGAISGVAAFFQLTHGRPHLLLPTPRQSQQPATTATVGK